MPQTVQSDQSLLALPPIEERRLGPFRVESVIFAFFLIAAVLDLSASYGRYGGWLTATQGQVLHVCVYCAIALSAIAIVRRLSYLPRVRVMLEIALTAIVVGEVLDLLRSVERLRGIPLVSEIGSPYGDLLNRSLQTIGLSLYMASFYICLLELNGVEGRLRFALQNMPVMLDAVDADGVFLEWNRECERVTGYSAAEIVDNPNAMAMLYPEGQSAGRFPAGQTNADDYRDWETVIVCKDGARKTISWSSQSGTFAIAGWAAWGIGVDLTLSRSLEQELMRIERADAVGKLVGGIAGQHALLLDPVRSQLESLHTEMRDARAGVVEEALRALNRMSEIVRQLAMLGRKSRTLPGNTDLRPIIEHVIGEIQATHPAGKDVDIRLVLGNEPIKAAVPADDFDRALSAVLRNAIEAAVDAGASSNVIEISHARFVETGRPPDRVLKTGMTGTPRIVAVLTVRDYGRGIPPELIDRVFEPFVTTKPLGEHAGLGLTVAQSLLRRVRGRIELNSEPSGGVAARLCMPVNAPNSPAIS